MDYTLDFDWSNKDELKINLKRWAYDENAILLEQDEDLLFHDMVWTEMVFLFMFDENCIKREYIIVNLKNYIREIFSRKKSLSDLEKIQELFINDMQTYCSKTNDPLICNCVAFFMSCKMKLDNQRK